MTKSRCNLVGRVATLVLIATGFIAASASPQAAVKQKTSYTYYTVKGRTALDLVQHMHTYGTRGVGAFDKAYASIVMQDYKILGDAKQSGSRCSVRGFGMSFKFKITLPRLVGARQTNRKARGLFKRFQAFARRHELYHRKLTVGCARKAERRIRRMRSETSCSNWSNKAGKILVAEFKRCEKLHIAFDRREQKVLLRTPLMRAAIKQSKTSRGSLAGRRSLENEIRQRWNDVR